MPLYEFECNKCKQVFELLIRNAADEKAVSCPKCRHNKVTKLLSTFRMGGGGGDGPGTPSSGGKPSGSPANRGKSSCGSCASGSCSTCH